MIRWPDGSRTYELGGTSWFVGAEGIPELGPDASDAEVERWITDNWVLPDTDTQIEQAMAELDVIETGKALAARQHAAWHRGLRRTLIEGCVPPLVAGLCVLAGMWGLIGLVVMHVAVLFVTAPTRVGAVSYGVSMAGACGLIGMGGGLL